MGDYSVNFEDTEKAGASTLTLTDGIIVIKKAGSSGGGKQTVC